MAHEPKTHKAEHGSSTIWHVTTDALGRTIRYITSNEIDVASAAVCSILDPNGDEPSCRIDPATGERKLMGGEADEPYPRTGLIVLGWTKYTRPDLAETAAMTGINGHIAAEAVRRALQD